MRALLRLLVLLPIACMGCGPTVDLTKGLEFVDVSTGLVDQGIVNGQNKLVPSITFKLKNVSDQNLVALQINAMFRKVDSPNEDWGSGFVLVTRSDALAPGATSRPITINSTLGYTGLEPRAEMLNNKAFVDSRVELAAKYSSVQWARVADFPIDRRLLTQ
jgi:hypothetical protein